jgi:hypothetical protein
MHFMFSLLCWVYSNFKLFWLTDKTVLDFVFFVFVQVIKYGVRSEAFTVAKVDKIFSGYQSCQLVKN